MPQPSRKFIESLHLFDSLLDVRWSSMLSAYVVDRKSYVPDSEVKFLISRRDRADKWVKEMKENGPEKEKKRKHLAGVHEELESARKGRRVIFFTRQLDRTTFDRLAFSDTQRYGGYSRMADEIENEEKNAEKKQRKNHASELDDANRDAFDKLNFILDKKYARLESGVKDLNTLLHGR